VVDIYCISALFRKLPVSPNGKLTGRVPALSTTDDLVGADFNGYLASGLSG
jgi:hypothetical protein